jgi:glycosyltransferase involved in cell wall biosynthesis
MEEDKARGEGMMNVEVLVAAMHQKDHSLIEKMHLKSDAIVANQSDYNSIESFEWNGYKIRYLNFAERGVGLNRNNALMRASGDICLFADDDMVYVDDYVGKVQKAFEKYPDADVIAFNLIEPKITRYVIKKAYKVGFLSYLRFGTARVAVRLKSIREKGIYFNQCFGGGTEHSHGEDNIFLTDCLRKGLKMYAIPEYIAELTEERPSTWKCGYNEKYFYDQGALYRMISPRWWKLLCLQDALRHRNLYKCGWLCSYRKMTGALK